MVDENGVPEPQETGSEGTQQPAPVVAEPPDEVIRPLSKFPLAATIEGLASSKARQMGGELVAGLIAGYSTHMATELAESKKETQSLREKNDSLAEELHHARTRCAVLEGENRTKHLKNTAITFGVGLIALGIQLIGNDLWGYGVAAVVPGVVLLLLGWFTSPARNPDDRS